jgi:hypothetical protein
MNCAFERSSRRCEVAGGSGGSDGYRHWNDDIAVGDASLADLEETITVGAMDIHSALLNFSNVRRVLSPFPLNPLTPTDPSPPTQCEGRHIRTSRFHPLLRNHLQHDLRRPKRHLNAHTPQVSPRYYWERIRRLVCASEEKGSMRVALGEGFTSDPGRGIRWRRMAFRGSGQVSRAMVYFRVSYGVKSIVSRADTHCHVGRDEFIANLCCRRVTKRSISESRRS